jgi:hypothetical protein
MARMIRLVTMLGKTITIITTTIMELTIANQR